MITEIQRQWAIDDFGAFMKSDGVVHPVGVFASRIRVRVRVRVGVRG